MFNIFKKKKDCIDSLVNKSDVGGIVVSSESEGEPFEALYRLAERNHDVFSILLFLAKLDNRFMAREKDAIARFAMSESGCQNICADDVDRLYASWPKPSIKEFREILSNGTSFQSVEGLLETCEVILGRQADTNPMAKILEDEIRAAIRIETA